MVDLLVAYLVQPMADSTVDLMEPMMVQPMGYLLVAYLVLSMVELLVDLKEPTMVDSMVDL